MFSSSTAVNCEIVSEDANEDLKEKTENINSKKLGKMIPHNKLECLKN